MAITYICRHCKQHIGTLEKHKVDAAMLGLHALSNSEQREMVQHTGEGEMQIQTICDQCEETLKTHPQYYELDYFIH